MRRSRGTSAMFGMETAPRATSAPQAGLRSASSTKAPHPAAMRSIGSWVASRRGWRKLVEFLREFVGDRALQLGETIEVHVEGALRHRRLADHVVHSHGLDGAAAV